MKLRSARRQRLDPSGLRLPLIALIDVVLFLLFYFIIAGNIDQEEADLEATMAVLGTGKMDPASNLLDAQVLVVGTDASGPSYRVGSDDFRDRASLQTLLQTLPKDAGVVVRSAATTPFEIVAGAIQVAHNAGFTKVTYVPGGPLPQPAPSGAAPSP
ncbi:MAG: biopolymer transporter ExbD [Phycisphaerales bacterium]